MFQHLVFRGSDLLLYVGFSRGPAWVDNEMKHL